MLNSLSLTGMRRRESTYTCSSLEARTETKDQGNRGRSLEPYVVGSNSCAYSKAMHRAA